MLMIRFQRVTVVALEFWWSGSEGYQFLHDNFNDQVPKGNSCCMTMLMIRFQKVTVVALKFWWSGPTVMVTVFAWQFWWSGSKWGQLLNDKFDGQVYHGNSCCMTAFMVRMLTAVTWQLWWSYSTSTLNSFKKKAQLQFTRNWHCNQKMRRWIIMYFGLCLHGNVPNGKKVHNICVWARVTCVQ